MNQQLANYEDILKDNFLKEIFQEYGIFPYDGSSEEPNKVFDKILRDLSSPELILPVLGVQGAGKSSFINALIFDDIVLPVDADETTCVPTEIRYSESEEKKCLVYFKSGRIEEIALGEKTLQEFVHNQYNPANERGVVRIEIKINIPILKNGIVLVDLPGVGSLTEANVKTTLSYLQKAVGAIYLLRTVPPITRSESFFIKESLPFFNKIWFVQNRWNDESDVEAQDGMEHNLTILKNIADKINFDQKNLQIIIINVYKALNGRITKDKNMINESGINYFLDEITKTNIQWKEILYNNVKERILLSLNEAIELINAREKNFLSDKENILKEIKEEEEFFNKNLIKIKSKVNDFLNEFYNDISSLRKKIETECIKSKESLRKEMARIIEGGVFDGAELTKAYDDWATYVSENLYEKTYQYFLDFKRETEKKINMLNITSWRKFHFEKGEVSIEEGIKYEKAIMYVGTTVSCAYGASAGALAAAKIGAAIGSSLGPVGTVIGGILGGTIVGLFGGWLFGKAKRFVENGRINEAKKCVNQAVNQFYINAKSYYFSLLNEEEKQIKEGLNKWIENDERTFEEQKNMKLKDLQSTKEYKDKLIAKVKEQKKYIENKKTLLQENKKGG